MKIGISGTGLVSALGRGWPPTGGSRPPRIEASKNGHLPALRVPPGTTSDIDSFPRLRRSGDISRFAVAAACDAVAGIDPGLLPEIPLIFATTDGGVSHSTRFFAPIETSGCGKGSPLLFPETVYNAPASHVAAHLGLLAGATSLVGDSSIGLAAVCAACDLIASGTSPAILVVVANEYDPMACEAYSRAGICAGNESSPLPPLTEGAAALLLTSHPGPTASIEQWIEGPPLRSAGLLPAALSSLANFLRNPHSLNTPVVAHVPGPSAASSPFPTTPLLPGEGLAFTDLAQLVVATGGDAPIPELLVLSLGFHGQNAGLRLTQRCATP